MKGVFKCAMEDDERRSRRVKRSSLGMPMCTPIKYSRRLKRLSLGMPPCIPLLHQQSSVRPSSHYIFITSCVICYAWSVSLLGLLFLFSLALLAVQNKLYPSLLCVGEKHAPLQSRTHHRIFFMLIFLLLCVLYLFVAT